MSAGRGQARVRSGGPVPRPRGAGTRRQGASRAPSPVSQASARRFARRAMARRVARLRPLVVLVAIVALLGGGVWVVLGSSWLSVGHVVVHGAQRVPATAIEAAARVPVGSAMVRLDATAVAARVEALPAVASVEVSRSWPGTVVIDVHERVPAAVLVTGGSAQLVDPAGVAFAAVPSPAPKLPQVRDVPAAATDRLRAAVAVARSLPADLAGQTGYLTAGSPDSVVLHLSKGRTVVWGSPAQGAEKAAVVRTLLASQKAAVYDVSAPDAPTTAQS